MEKTNSSISDAILGENAGAWIASREFTTITKSTWKIFGSFERTIQLLDPPVVYSHHIHFSIGENYQELYLNRTKTSRWWNSLFLNNPSIVTFRDQPNPAPVRYPRRFPRTMMRNNGNSRMTTAVMLVAPGVLPRIDRHHPFQILPSKSGPAMLRYHLPFWSTTKARVPLSFGTTCTELSTQLPSKWLP